MSRKYKKLKERIDYLTFELVIINKELSILLKKIYLLEETLNK